jgi:hypothetical protein
LGRPWECFNPRITERVDEKSLSLAFSYSPNYMSALMEFSGVIFGVKAHYSHVAKYVGLGMLPMIFPGEVKYIWMRRRDLLGQAISLSKAIQTNLWNSSMHAQGQVPVYSYWHISACMEDIILEDRGWHMYFAERRLTPYKLFYEEFLGWEQSRIEEIWHFLGRPNPETPTLTNNSKLEKQADEVSLEWHERYLREDGRYGQT